jgi:HAMP domain-containing protein
LQQYIVILVLLVSGGLVTSGALEVMFSYQDTLTGILAVQREKASSAALRIEQFVLNEEQHVRYAVPQPWSAPTTSLDQRLEQYQQLLRQSAAVSEVSYIDPTGREQLRISRIALNSVGSGADRSNEPGFVQPRSGKTYFGPVYFRRGSEPHLTIGLPDGGPNAGVTVAEINLKFIWDVVAGIKIGREGYAYVVDERGQLLAHPDMTLVLQRSDFSGRPQLQAVRAAQAQPAPDNPAAIIARDAKGRQTLTAYAPVGALAWTILVEQPLDEVYAPLYGALLRTGLLILIGLGISVLASVFLARRMVTPIRLLGNAARRVGGDTPDRAFDPDTLRGLGGRADELGQLARAFQRMALDVFAREDRLRRQVSDLRIQIDTSKKARQVAQITETDYFQQLQERASSLRNRPGSPAGTRE